MYLPEEDSGQEAGTEESSGELTEDTEGGPEIGDNSKETESSQGSGKTA